MIVANWKMNGSFREIDCLINGLDCSGRLIISVPFIFLDYLLSSLKKKQFENVDVKVSAQDCSHFSNGPYTGDISASMLKDLGCDYVIIGHSERRKYHYETDEIIKLKVESSIISNIVPIVCIGESEIKNKEEEITKQLSLLCDANLIKNIIIAYEPIYSVGGLKPPSDVQIKESVDIIKQATNYLDNVKILYGGSVDEHNAENILSIIGINGLLLGRASLDYKKLNIITSLSSKIQ